MDILTQGLLGSVLAQSVAKKEEFKYAAFIGFLAGLLADADIFISSSSDPLLNIEYHRHFTHSFFFVPIGAAIAAIILWPFFKKQLKPARLYLYALLGYSMSGLLDACTSYGTHLLWPLSNERIAFNIISIIDPIFTGILIIALITAFRKKMITAARAGLVLCLFYLGLGYYQSLRAQDMAINLALSRGHNASHYIVKPTIGNNILWRSVYLHNNRFYVDAIRVGLFNTGKVYTGSTIKKFELSSDLPEVDGASVLSADINRFSVFSNNYVALDLSQDNVIGDIRYSMLPTSVKPLWGIVFDKNNQDKHVDYQFFRSSTPEARQQFISMLFGD